MSHFKLRHLRLLLVLLCAGILCVQQGAALVYAQNFSAKSIDASKCKVISKDNFKKLKELVRIPPLFSDSFLRGVGLAWSPDSTAIAYSSYGGMSFYNLSHGESGYLALYHDDWYVWDVAYSPDGKSIASASGAVQLWDLQTDYPQTIANFSKTDEELAFSVAFSPDGKLLAASSRKGIVHIWDSESGEEKFTFHDSHVGYGGQIRFSPDGKKIAQASSHDNYLSVWDIETSKELLSESQNAPVDDLSFSPDGQTLASVNELRRLSVRSVSSLSQVLLSAELYAPRAFTLAFSPDSTLLAVGDEFNLHLIGVDSLFQVEKSWTATSLYHDNIGTEVVEFSPNGKFVAGRLSDNTHVIWGVC